MRHQLKTTWRGGFGVRDPEAAAFTQPIPTTPSSIYSRFLIKLLFRSVDTFFFWPLLLLWGRGFFPSFSLSLFDVFPFNCSSSPTFSCGQRPKERGDSLRSLLFFFFGKKIIKIPVFPLFFFKLYYLGLSRLYTSDIGLNLHPLLQNKESFSEITMGFYVLV